MQDRECIVLLRGALPRLGLRWRGFQQVRRQVCKRIGWRIRELGLADVAAYRERLECAPEEWPEFDSLSAMIDVSWGPGIARRCRAMVLAAVLVPWSLPAHAEGDTLAGRELAVEWCSRCHHIWRGGGMADDPPSFSVIAMFRTPEEIRSNILAPHAMMPEVARILGLNVDDLVAYITSLSRPPQ